MAKRQKASRKEGHDLKRVKKTLKKKDDFPKEDSADDLELEDVGEKRVESEEEMDLPSFGVEEEKEMVDDPYQKWYNKRSFTDQDKTKADAILSSYSMESVSIADHLQCKISTNGIEPINSMLSSDAFTPLKARLEPQLQSHFEALKKDRIQQSLYQTISHYGDLLYASDEELATSNHHNDMLLTSLCIHVLNHILKAVDIETDHTNTIRARKRILNEQTHERIRKKEAETEGKPFVPLSDMDLDATITIPSYQDQGFTRAKVLVLLPFRYHAFSFMNRLLSLMPKNTQILGKSKFQEEFDEEPEIEGEKQPKWKQFFPGNNDDCFRVGISFDRRRVKCYADFYNSDLILASPLALRQLEAKRGFDYLSSIEICLIYGMDIICMQNVDHLRGVMEALNQTISRDRNTDYSRLREYYLSDFQKYMRQTIFVGKNVNSTILGLFHRSCFNTLSRLEIRPHYEGAVSDILSPPRQLFIRLPCDSPTQINQNKIQYLEGNVLKILNNSVYSKILLYCDNYFEYMYVKRLLMENCDERDCGIIDEYLDYSDNLRNRSYFYNGTIRILLFSGRFQYFKRMNIKGAHSVYFVGLPSYPEFYSDIVNGMNERESDKERLNVGVTVLFTRYDTYSLERIVGSSRYKKMLTGKRDKFMFC